MSNPRIRVGIDVGGTFTDAVAIDARTMQLIGQAKVPTSHHHVDGVAHGIIEALERLLDNVGARPDDVAFLAHGTTQATNALLEGDVAAVGLIGIGSGPAATITRHLASLSKLQTTPGKQLPLTYVHVADPTDGPAVKAAVQQLQQAGAQVIVATEPFSVDLSDGEDEVLTIARENGILATGAHEITSLYGLRKRTRTAIVNAAILPKMLTTADLVDSSISKAGVTAPLMVMRCDGGVMSLDEMRRRPLLTVLSGPAAGVAGALMQERVSEGIFLETGGTSTDISVIHGGKVAIRYATILGEQSYLSALDVRTVGIGGGSMIRLGNGAVTSVGPRSAHIAGLPYACFADPQDLQNAKVATISPMADDPDDYAVIDASGGRFAITMTCAANALGLVPETDFAYANPTSAQLALAALAQSLGTDVAGAATAVLNSGIQPVRAVVERMIRDYRLEPDAIRLVGGGGGAASVLPHLSQAVGQPGVIADHNEVISPIGVALALIREQIERIIPGAGPEQILAVRNEAAQAVLAEGAAPGAIEVEVTVDAQTNTVRAIATGASELRTQDRSHHLGDDELRAIAAVSLRADPGGIEVLAHTVAHTVFGVERPRRLRRPRHFIRVVDSDGVIRLASSDARIEITNVSGALETLRGLLHTTTTYGDGGVRAPAVHLLIGARIADLTGVLDSESLLALAQGELSNLPPDETVVAIVEPRS
ncbi:MAG: N-methylhydantoinase A/acetone carboxylase, beta subunit [Frankiales bacterium]|nr:N-methylhydantoinase A/acetone carboxylase, beta subunit [Frankiales bacterium]